MDPAPDNVIVFDGVCNLCSRAVGFIIARDSQRTFRFSPMQSERGAELLATHGIPADDVDTFLLIRNGTPYIRSDAAIAIAKALDGPWRWLSVLEVIPRGVRDWVYSTIVRNRYRWFGKRSECLVPTADHESRFV